jgi:hypothetical protein
MKKVVVLLGLIVLLSSCIGIKNSVQFNRDGSGTVTMEYRISKMLTEMGEGSSDAPLPLSQDDLKEAVSENPNLELKSVEQWDDEKDVYISAVIGFQKVNEFTDVESFAAMPMSLEKQGGEFVYRQLISEGNTEGEEEAELDEETKKTMEAFFEGYELSFTVVAPSEITYHSLGDLAADRRSVTYSIPLLEMDKLEEETVLEVKWRS